MIRGHGMFCVHHRIPNLISLGEQVILFGATTLFSGSMFMVVSDARSDGTKSMTSALDRRYGTRIERE
jgi:hypothetical protein